MTTGKNVEPESPALVNNGPQLTQEPESSVGDPDPEAVPDEADGLTPTSTTHLLVQDDIRQYRFTALNTECPSTRLLTLYPDADGTPLSGSLTIHVLDHRMPRYDAISYCWGSGVDERSNFIDIDGKGLPITANAHQTLVDCRSPKHKIRLWMDQICLNQDDVEELSKNIGHNMQYIYRHARTVMAYIASDVEHINVLFNVMQILSDDWSKWYGKWLSWRRRQVSVDSELRKVLGPNLRLFPNSFAKLRPYESQVAEFHEARANFLGKPRYFHRTWIVPEASLAKKLFLKVGKATAPWDGIHWVCADPQTMIGSDGRLEFSLAHGWKAAMAIQMLRNNLHYPRTPLTWSFIWQKIRDSMLCRGKDSLREVSEAFRGYFKPKALSLPIILLLREFRHQSATDDRDKIFGLVGLADESVHNFLPKIGYESSTTNLYFYFAIMYIYVNRTLDVLNATCSSISLSFSNFPWWVPDWTHEIPVCDTKYCLPTYKFSYHSAGMRFPAVVDFLKPSLALVLLGIEFDTVVSVTEFALNVNNYLDAKDNTWKQWTEFAMTESEDGRSNPYPDTRSARWESYWRTLVYDSDGAGGHAPEGLGEDFAAFLDCNPDAKVENVGGRIVFKQRKLYRTKRGYLGNGCSIVEPGDKIYILHGGRFPMILRLKEEVEGTMAGLIPEQAGEERKLLGYKMIGGDTFIHGLCDGEAFDIAEQEGVSPGEVCLV